MKRKTARIAILIGLAVLMSALAAGTALAAKSATFSMVRSTNAAAAGCIPGAQARVTINSIGPVEVMNVAAKKLPKNREFDLFVTQVPDAPFGVSWYQADMVSNGKGEANVRVIGIFNEETFTVAPGSAPAPQVHQGDAASNPVFGPVHSFHLGLWFNSPGAAKAAGCTGNQTIVTPFNGEHNAGVQALSTTNFGDQNGPLRKITP